MAAENPSIKDLAKARVIVVGDAMVDRWVWGHWSKIGGEGIPVFLTERVEDRPGGAANVVENIRALGAEATLLTAGVSALKTRYSARQTIFRVDEETIDPIDGTAQAVILTALASIQADVLVISDYAKGVCTPELCQALIGWAKVNDVRVVSDPKGKDWRKYEGSYVLTPNEHEYDGRTHGAGEHIIVTRGADGADIVYFNERRDRIKGHPVTVRDICGAGDTFTGALSCALAAGFDLPQAARIANAAASVVVGKVGTSTCDLAELIAALA